MKVICIRSEGCYPRLLFQRIYVVAEETNGCYRLKGISGFYLKNRFQVLEESALDNSLYPTLLDQHNAKPPAPDERQDT